MTINMMKRIRSVLKKEMFYPNSFHMHTFKFNSFLVKISKFAGFIKQMIFMVSNFS